MCFALFFGFLLLLLLGIVAQVYSLAAIKAMSFNVLCSFCTIGSHEYDPWHTRLGYFKSLFQLHKPDILGVQELSFDSEVKEFLSMFPSNEFAAIWHQSAFKSWPDATLFYNSTKFEPEKSGSWWYPRYSSHEVMFRLLVWTLMRDVQTGQKFFVATTHYDNNTPAQYYSAMHMINETAPWLNESLPIVILGDFNSKPHTDAFKYLVGNSKYNLTDVSTTAEQIKLSSNQEPAPTFDNAQMIDHIFVYSQNKIVVPVFTYDTHVFGDLKRYPSDHRPIMALLEFQ